MKQTLKAMEEPGPRAPRRLVIFMYDFAMTGVVRNAVRLANALVERGQVVYLLVCTDEGREHHDIDPRAKVVVQPALAASASRGFALASAIPGIRRQLRTLRPDVLLSAGNHGHLAALAASFGLRGMQRMVRISNDPDHPGDGWLLRKVRRFLLRTMASHSDRLLLVSPQLMAHPCLREASRAGRTVAVPNGVATETIRKLAAERCDHPWANGNEPLLVTVGRLARQKNLATLIRALALANETTAINLLIVGPGPASLRAELVALATQLGVAHRVDLVGEKLNPYPFMRAADAFVLPSLWEGRSNVLLEAMACDVPIVASRRAGDAGDLLGEGQFGLLVDPLNVREMAGAILQQIGHGACRPGSRSLEYDQAVALDRACAVLLGEVWESGKASANLHL